MVPEVDMAARRAAIAELSLEEAVLEEAVLDEKRGMRAKCSGERGAASDDLCLSRHNFLPL